MLHTTKSFFMWKTNSRAWLYRGNLLDWLTDVTNYVPTFCGSLAAWEMSEFDGLALGYDDWLDNAKILAKLNSVVIFCFGRDKVSDIVRLWPS